MDEVEQLSCLIGVSFSINNLLSFDHFIFGCWSFKIDLQDIFFYIKKAHFQWYKLQTFSLFAIFFNLMEVFAVKEFLFLHSQLYWTFLFWLLGFVSYLERTSPHSKIIFKVISLF